jgi:hypothetical protein
VNISTFRSSVMLLAFLVTAAAPVVAQQHRSSDVRISIQAVNDPTDPSPLPPPPDFGITSFALHF